MRSVIAIIILAHIAAYYWRSETGGGEAESLRERHLEERMEKYRQKKEFTETVGEQSWLLQEEQ